MRISDKTPYRNENGQISFIGRVKGTLKYGFNWYPEVMAQEKIIAILNKVLDRNYILLRNFSLPETEISLPLVLIGPPGMFLISAVSQRGVYSIRDDEWGKLAGETFVPARFNLVQHNIKLGRVLKAYLNRNGFKGEFVVEPVLAAADPGMHIETLRPAARVVLNDALERFAISMTQAHPILNPERIVDLALVMVKGLQKETPFLPEHGALVTPIPVPAGKEIRDTLSPPDQPEQDLPDSFSGDNLDFSFNDHWNDNQTLQSQIEPSTSDQPDAGQDPAPQPAFGQTPAFEGFGQDYSSFFEEENSPEESTGSETSAQPDSGNVEPEESGETWLDDSSEPEPTVAAKTLRFGMTRNHLLILGAIIFVWLLLMAGFIYLIRL